MTTVFLLLVGGQFGYIVGRPGHFAESQKKIGYWQQRSSCTLRQFLQANPFCLCNPNSAQHGLLVELLELSFFRHCLDRPPPFCRQSIAGIRHLLR